MWPRWSPEVALVLIAALGACRQDMHDQPKYKPLSVSTFYPDGTSARELVPGTVARGSTRAEGTFTTGLAPGATPNGGGDAALRALQTPPADVAAAPDKVQLAAWRAIHAAGAVGGVPAREDAAYATDLPVPLTRELLLRGQERFDIFCSPCHDRTGAGGGMIVRKGFFPPPSLHADRLRAAPVGHFFDVITRGFGAMPSYASQVPPADRWAIIAYVKALQLSQDVPAAQLSAADRAALATGGRP